MKKKFLVFALLTFLAVAKKSPAADPFDAFLVYPQSIRQAVIEALNDPLALLGLFDIQFRASQEFKAFYQGLSPDLQKKVLKLVPFPNLLKTLNALGAKDPAEVEKALKNFPSEVHGDAKYLLAKNPDLLAKLDQMDNRPEQEAVALIGGLPGKGQTAYLQVLRHSEILKTLAKILGVTPSTLPDFKKNPQSLNPKIQELQAKLAQAATPKEPKLATAPGDDSKAMDPLQKQADQMNRELDTELKVDPEPKGAAQMNVNFTLYPFYNPFTDQWAFPFWFGFGDWW